MPDDTIHVSVSTNAEKATFEDRKVEVVSKTAKDVVEVRSDDIIVVKQVPAPQAATNLHGLVTDVAVNATVAIVSHTPTIAYSILGFQVSGDSDITLRLRVNGEIKALDSLNVMKQSTQVLLPMAIAVNPGIPIVLEGSNVGLGPARMEAILLGQQIAL